MERIHKIWEHPLYREQFQALQEAEADRIFCRHTLEHFLDVARIACIQNLESDAGLPKVLIYAAALLHDIGRYQQLLLGIPHEKAGAALAEQIMKECGFSREETEIVCLAILRHRDHPSPQITTASNTCFADGTSPVDSSDALSRLLYRADKLSRNCFSCPASEECNWHADKKNLRISI